MNRAAFISIYVLKHPVSGEIRYVGKTVKKLSDRLKIHIWAAAKGNKTHRCNWLRQLAKDGLVPVIEEIERLDIDANWQERESFWITHYRGAGFSLTNATSGGEGMHGATHTQEARRLISLAHKGKAISQDQREKQSAAMAGRALTDEHKQRISAATRGKKRSELTKRRMSAAWQLRPQGCNAGERNGRAKITAEQAARIRGSLLPLSVIMSLYDISKTQASRLRRGEQWK